MLAGLRAAADHTRVAGTSPVRHTTVWRTGLVPAAKEKNTLPSFDRTALATPACRSPCTAQFTRSNSYLTRLAQMPEIHEKRGAGGTRVAECAVPKGPFRQIISKCGDIGDGVAVAGWTASLPFSIAMSDDYAWASSSPSLVGRMTGSSASLGPNEHLQRTLFYYQS
jgi:hypothetical protein